MNKPRLKPNDSYGSGAKRKKNTLSASSGMYDDDLKNGKEKEQSAEIHLVSLRVADLELALAATISERDGAVELMQLAQAELKSLKQNFEDECKRLRAEVAERNADVLSARKENEELQRVRNQLTQDIDVRFEELASLTCMLNEMRLRELANAKHFDELKALTSDVARLTEKLQHTENNLCTKETQVQILARKLVKLQARHKAQVHIKPVSLSTFRARTRWTKDKRKRALLEQLHLLQMCGLFDEAWYLETYQDIREAGVDPAEHYLIYGWREMRDPGPLFSTKAYVERYPDVVAADINPLLHYIKHGSDEGRLIQSAVVEF